MSSKLPKTSKRLLLGDAGQLGAKGGDLRIGGGPDIGSELLHLRMAVYRASGAPMPSESRPKQTRCPVIPK